MRLLCSYEYQEASIVTKRGIPQWDKLGRWLSKSIKSNDSHYFEALVMLPEGPELCEAEISLNRNGIQNTEFGNWVTTTVHKQNKIPFPGGHEKQTQKERNEKLNPKAKSKQRSN